MVTIHLTPTNHLAIELQHISKKYPILSVFYHYQKWFKYHILAHIYIYMCHRGKNKNLTALKSNSNTVWFNFQTYIYIYIYI